MTSDRRAACVLGTATAFLATTAVALGATPASGGWTGTTNMPLTVFGQTVKQKVATSFSVYRAADGSRHLKRFRLGGFKLACNPSSGGAFGSNGFLSRAKPKVSRGAFSFTSHNDSSGMTKVLKARGSFTSKKRAAGTLVVTVTTSKYTCTSHRVHWVAQLGSGGTPTGAPK